MHFALKNYQQELQQFLHWLGPYVASAPGSIVGEWQTEEARMDEEMGDPSRRPTLLVARTDAILALVDERHRPSKATSHW